MATMDLNAKGRFAPPPTLPTHAQSVSTTVGGWDGVIARTHWRLGDESVVDGADFYLGNDEMGHLHLDGTAHIVAERSVRDALIHAKLAQPFPWSDAFVVVPTKRESDVEHARWVFALRYDALRGTAKSVLLARIAERMI
jgi:hypothetical protein